MSTLDNPPVGKIAPTVAVGGEALYQSLTSGFIIRRNSVFFEVETRRKRRRHSADMICQIIIYQRTCDRLVL